MDFAIDKNRIYTQEEIEKIAKMLIELENIDMDILADLENY